jgi:hypothetical protein
VHLIPSIGPKTHVFGHFGPFRYCRKSMQNWPNWRHSGPSSLNEDASKFFATSAPNPLDWTLNSCFGCFGPFRYCLKVDAKLAELAPLTQKFAKRSSVRTFHNEPTDPLHWTQNSCFGAFRTVSLLHESRCQTGRTGAINAQVR